MFLPKGKIQYRIIYIYIRASLYIVLSNVKILSLKTSICNVLHYHYVEQDLLKRRVHMWNFFSWISCGWWYCLQIHQKQCVSKLVVTIKICSNPVSRSKYDELPKFEFVVFVSSGTIKGSATQLSSVQALVVPPLAMHSSPLNFAGFNTT